MESLANHIEFAEQDLEFQKEELEEAVEHEKSNKDKLQSDILDKETELRAAKRS